MFVGLDNYSRYKHSVGCALIVWHFTQDRRQTIAALLHDIATPTFAHVVDFLNGDHLKQESTENGTVNIIASSPEIMTRLKEWNIELEEVADYHVYPIADNDSPKLSADRLEYTLSNLVNYRITPTEKIKEWYDHLMVGKKEEGEDELMFDDFQIAEAFCLSALETSKIYVADEDRFAMQTLSELLCKHITRGVLSKNDLYRTESEVIALLQQDEEARQDWERFRALRHIHRGNHAGAKTVLSKRRYINPYLNGKGRMVHLSDMFAQALEPFLSQRLDEPLWGE